MNKHSKREIWVVAGALLSICLAISLLTVCYKTELFALFHIKEKFEIHGIDVSNHQGDIDWEKVDKQRYAFVFIKATEGGDFKDKRFLENWQGARQHGLLVGAYHFYRNCKTGAEQARNFIDAVPKVKGSLPPVIDVEFQKVCDETLTADQLQQQIAIMATTLHQHYGQKPILYTTPNYYRAYLKGKFDDYPLWIQDTKHQPSRFDRRPWLIWQYSHAAQVAGIATPVDANVFRGDWQQLQELTHSTK